MDNLQGIRTILEFYGALGIERLPLAVPSFHAPAMPERAALASSPERESALKALRDEIGNCNLCKLHQGRTNLVFGEGNADARLMFIGEAPGRDEDAQGRPFVGDAGKLLTKLIEKLGLSRTEVYIGNIAKCRPPQNRDPEEDEIGSCMPFIKRQIKIISPDVIIALGRISAQTLLNTKTTISRLRGNFYEFEGVPLMPTFHPAYLLRNPKDKQIVLNDALEAMKKIGRQNQ